MKFILPLKENIAQLSLVTLPIYLITTKLINKMQNCYNFKLANEYQVGMNTF